MICQEAGYALVREANEVRSSARPRLTIVNRNGTHIAGVLPFVKRTEPSSYQVWLPIRPLLISGDNLSHVLIMINGWFLLRSFTIQLCIR